MIELSGLILGRQRLYLGITAGFIYLYLHISVLEWHVCIRLTDNGFSIFRINDIEDLYSINSYFAIGRYEGADYIKYSTLGQVCFCFTYASAVPGSFLLIPAE